MYTIRLVDPRKERTLWAAIVAGQRACQEREGTSPGPAEADPFTGRMFAVAVLDREGIPVAGARLHLRDNEHRLPVERQLRGSALLASELEERAVQGVGELGGLWWSEELPPARVAAAVAAAAAAHAPIVGVRHLVTFLDPQHRLDDALGFRHDERFDEYPRPAAGRRSVVRWCDARTLESAERPARRAILLQRRVLARGQRLRLDPRAAAAAPLKEKFA